MAATKQIVVRNKVNGSDQFSTASNTAYVSQKETFIGYLMSYWELATLILTIKNGFPLVQNSDKRFNYGTNQYPSAEQKQGKENVSSY